MGTAKKRAISDSDSESANMLSSSDQTSPKGNWICLSSESAKHALVPLVEKNGSYDPRLNSDCRGPYFNLVRNKLVQLDVWDAENNLVAPWTFYDALKPGTLVLMMCTLHCFVMKDRKPTRK
ncbi:hypothetical protein C0992_008425, partial [Termitomyces sp. T32_za158]